MQTNLMYRFIPLIFLFFVLLPGKGNATHIVGGEMTYTCLGNDQYEIKLTIFRDCFNGNPLAFFDDPAKIGIYNSFGVLIDSLLIPFDPMLNDTLDPVLSDSCLVVPPNVCVHTTTYTGIKTLPQIPGGYQLIYQRCCRNFTIVNIVGPLDTGATFGVNISESALNECNSSALFNQWPPIYICVNEPINFDQSAVDADGDSIVYSLCIPLDGATPATPEPFPFEQTIPQPVVWVDPPYNLSNVLGGIPLSIDPNTGLLTGTPNTIGQFVVGICLEEYRDGALISTTRRDFQYNVGLCGAAVAAYAAPELYCDGLEVSFENQSIGGSNYQWNFNDPAYPDSIVTVENPTWVFSDTGTYVVELIVGDMIQCSDTFEQEITVHLPSLFADFNFSYANCTDSLTIEVADLSFDTIVDIASWDWQLVDANNILLASSSLQNPVFNVTTSTEATLTLIITATNGCTQEFTQTFPANVFNEDTFPDEISACFDNSVPLNPNPLPGVTYMWTPPNGLDDPNSSTPLASPDSTTTYVVFIDNQGQCELYDTVTVVVDTLAAEFAADVPCDFEVFFTDDSFNAQNYTWYFNDPGNPNATSNLQNPSFVYSDTGTFTAMLVVDNGEFCIDTAYQVFNIDSPELFPSFDFDVVNCTDSFVVELMDMSSHLGGLNFDWTWYISEGGSVIDSFMIQNPTVSVSSSSTYTIDLVITDDNGCRSQVTEVIEAQVFGEDFIPDAMLICANDSVQLNPNPVNGLSYFWSPPTGLSDPNVPSPNAFPGGNTTYSVEITDQYGCVFTDEVMVTVDNTFEPTLEGYVESDTIFVGDTTQIFTTQDPNYNYSWEFSESLSDLGISNPLAFPLENTTYTLVVTDASGCENTIQFLVVVTESPCDDPNIFLPNAFTPNGDGENDVLRLLGNGIEEMHLIIYNRWGQKVFETFDQSIGWDGTFKGSQLPPDAFGFYLTVRCINGDDYYKKGNITLLK